MQRITRRNFMRLGVGGTSALILGLYGCGATPGAAPRASASGAGGTTKGTVLVGDVIDHALTSDAWPGAFGYVTFRTHRALHDGRSVYYIRTDASDAEFAESERLVHVPLLNAARDRGITNDLYIFDDDRIPVIRHAPGSDSYTPLFQIHSVSGGGRLESASAIDAASRDGSIEVESTPVLVNYPLVKWNGGGLTVDDAKEEYLGGGQLIEPVDTEGGKVTLKLHEAFPGSYYILTDASLGGPADMMNVPVSAPTWELNRHQATDKVWVFVNGVEGSGAMGFQPAVFGHQAGHPAWSPFWDHYALEWIDPDKARLLTSASNIRSLREAGDLKEYNGVPPTDPQGFVVNCSVPVIGGNRTGA
ncbi:DUF7482 domain-containing protein [Thioalkalivibrio denitrificans]|nr:hypothetical protein [Thioalkalivibrio denitrificans]